MLRLDTASVIADGKLLNCTECVKTAYGYAAQYYMSADSLRGIRSLRVLMTLRDENGMIGIETDTKQTASLMAEMPYESPQALPGQYSMERQRIQIHGMFGGNLEFDAVTLTPSGDVTLEK